MVPGTGTVHWRLNGGGEEGMELVSQDRLGTQHTKTLLEIFLGVIINLGSVYRSRF